MEPTLLQSYEWASRVKIGEGSFSIVYKAKRINSDEWVAIKEIDMVNFKDPIFREALKMQIELMKNLKSDNIVGMYNSYMDDHSTYLVMELCESDLRKKMNSSSGKLKEPEAVLVLTHILRGFKVLINLGYIHRDVKPQNILIRLDRYKIADFGFSCKADMNYLQKLDLICGTPLYMAPQLLNEQAYTAKCDIWSLGIMLYEMVFGYGPWVCRNMESYRFNILNKPLSFPYNGKIGQHTKDFIKRCLVINEAKRIGWNELFAHPLIQEKKPGQIVEPIQISKSAVDILRKIQQSAARKSISILKAFKSRKLDMMNLKQFQEVCACLDPSVTNFEIRVLFEAIDTSKDELISYQEFMKMVLQNDFREANDIASRYIRQLIEMIKFRKIQIGSLFKIYDRNSSSTIDFLEFGKLVRQFLPRMPVGEIKILFNKFDKDKSGDISLKEFQFELTYGVISEDNEKMIKSQKAVRCLSALKAAIRYYQIDESDVMKVFDLNKDNRIDYKQFSNMVFAIDKYLPEQELKLMFDYIDVDREGTIDRSELKACFS